MKDFMNNIEKTRNTSEQIGFYEKMNDFIELSGGSIINKMVAFPVYATRQSVTTSIEKYEIYKLCKNVTGSIVECGVAGGFGLMSFAHFVSIFEPYHYARKIIGFDTY